MLGPEWLVVRACTATYHKEAVTSRQRLNHVAAVPFAETCCHGPDSGVRAPAGGSDFKNSTPATTFVPRKLSKAAMSRVNCHNFVLQVPCLIRRPQLRPRKRQKGIPC